MIDICFERPDGLACVHPDELERGKRRIHLGGVLRYGTENDATRHGVDISNLFRHQEIECEIVLSHETVHIILFYLRGEWTSRMFDNIDI